jgi:hypothetical protein
VALDELVLRRYRESCRAAAIPLWSPDDLRHRRISLMHQAGSRKVPICGVRTGTAPNCSYRFHRMHRMVTMRSWPLPLWRKWAVLGSNE